MTPARKIAAGALAAGLLFAASAVIYAALDDEVPPRLSARLSGPCHDAVASDDVYQRLALHMIQPSVGGGLLPNNATPERVRNAHATYAALRRDFLPTVRDVCLRAHVADWLAYFDNDADKMAEQRLKAPADRDDYESRQAREQDEVRALAVKLGVAP